MLADPTSFLDRIFASLQKKGFYEVPFLLDHICYRVETQLEYAELKAELLQTNELLAETLINGRPIATFRLAEPLVYQDRHIELLELPSPKEGSGYQKGYEHVEFVIGEAPANWLSRYPNLAWDTKGLYKAVNSDLRLQLDEGISVKFHEYPLDYVIEFLDE